MLSKPPIEWNWVDIYASHESAILKNPNHSLKIEHGEKL
jgi:hypothetical protein